MLALVLGVNACRRIVDLTPVVRDAIDSDGGFGPDAVDDTFDAGVAFDAG
ncbi:MAG TPA: hypothetical protein VGG28_09890 [Kofleriaceae bacterium]